MKLTGVLNESFFLEKLGEEEKVRYEEYKKIIKERHEEYLSTKEEVKRLLKDKAVKKDIVALLEMCRLQEALVEAGHKGFINMKSIKNDFIEKIVNEKGYSRSALKEMVKMYFDHELTTVKRTRAERDDRLPSSTCSFVHSVNFRVVERDYTKRFKKEEK